MVENLLELGGSFLALPRREVRLTANVRGVQAGKQPTTAR
jgi:hypothetical protein